MEIRDQIKAESDRPRKPVPTPEWPSVDGKLYVQCLSGDDRDEWDVFVTRHMEKVGDRFFTKLGTRGMRACLVAMACVDESGEPVFNEGDSSWLGDKGHEVLDRLYDAAREISGLDRSIEKNAAKNRPEPSGDDSSTD